MTEAIAPNTGYMQSADILARSGGTVNEYQMTLGDMEAMGLSGQKLYQEPEERTDLTRNCEKVIVVLVLTTIGFAIEDATRGRKRRQKQKDKYKK